ncbi:MAG TPA: aldo/keto reductase [Thermoplasmata archaeon]|nr:aldo/keto reductase [Thermoplasmata archaeon]
MPVLGLGVWRAASGKETQRAVATALDVGYRLIDTAKLYGNERDVGRAVRASKIPRDEIFITTKLWNTDHGSEAALRAFEQSRRELGVDSIDLYLIHWPVPGLRQESWKALLDLKEKGLARSIGVSNYTIRHLEELLSASPIPPSVNQVEFHPFLYQADLLAFCQGHRIQLEAYSPLTRGHRLDHPVIKAVAADYRRTPAQILIRWGLQHGLVVIPKSVRPERIRENAQVFDFELSGTDMARLDALDERSHVAWDPDDLP